MGAKRYLNGYVVARRGCFGGTYYYYVAAALTTPVGTE